MAAADDRARHSGRPLRDRAAVWILVGCTAVGVWLGVTAPEQSPVSPVPAAPVVTVVSGPAP